ncbi:hypothetical protein A3B57_04220 [Microgenomates group bacterium RIFCSPLOWO2_01_FULL_47_10]|nr:MAG: hypothetical protein A3B57_04220 [Microgenomates group bacterium RIFCSPLOWO2_01_FULL_47_10]
MSQIAFNIKDAYLGNNPIAGMEKPTDWLSSILPNAYILAGVLLFIYLLVGGFMMITSAGSSKDTGQAQQMITNAIIGFVLVFASYWIIQLIEILTGLTII